MTLAANTTARQGYTARLLNLKGLPQPRVAKTAFEAPDALFGWIYKQPEMATKEDCQAMLTRVDLERGSDDARSLLQRFGVRSIKDLFTGQYEQFFNYAYASLCYGVSPSRGFASGDEIMMPEFVRDRFLYYHKGKDCVWEVRGLQGAEVDNPKITDVSGQAEFEQRFVERGL